jgi:hypothetical protein
MDRGMVVETLAYHPEPKRRKGKEQAVIYIFVDSISFCDPHDIIRTTSNIHVCM